MSVHQTPGFLHRFLDIAERHPGALAVHSLDDDRRLSYSALRAEAELMKGALRSLALEPGARVLLLLPNGIPLVAAYLAAVGAGVVAVLVNDKLTSRELRAIVADARPTAVVTSAHLAAKHREVWASVASVRALLAVDAPPDGCGVATAAALPALAAAPEPLTAPDGDPAVAIQYTYKGLGHPLAVAHRYEALTTCADAILHDIHPLGVGSTVLVALPLYAVFGLCVLMVLPLGVGATMLMTSTLGAVDMADLLAEHQVTLASLVPDLVRQFIAQLKGRSTPVPALHPQLMIYSGASHLPGDVAEELGRRLGGRPILQGYGTTECMPVVLQSSVRATRPGALGRPMRWVDVRVVDEAGEDVGVGRTGELVVRGPTVTREYLGRPDATARFFRGGWFHTGDLVRREEDHHLFFVGRRLRITKVAAQMVDLAEIEDVARAHPAVSRARARVVHDGAGREAVRLTVATRGDLADDALTAHLRAALSPFKIPRALERAHVVGEDAPC